MLKLYLKYCLLWILRTTLLLFLPAFFTITANAQGWNWLNPTITGDDLIDVQFLDECTGCALGERGTVLKTLNSGKDWFEIYSDPQFNISAFYGVDSDDLWLLGFHRPMVPPWVSALQLRRSTDGGKNWQVMFQSDSSEGGQYFNYGLHDIYFINSSIGWAVGDSGLVLKTEDSGQSWSGTFIPTEYSLHQIVALNASQAYASGGEFYISFTGSDTSFSWGELHKTEDGGSSWTTVYQDSIYFEDIFFLDNFNAHATGSKITVPYIGTERLEHYILKSTDGGINWGESIITGGIGYSWPTDIYFPTQQIGFATGYGGSTFRTFNGGNTWEPMSILGRNIHRLHRIDFADEMSGVIVGKTGLL